MKLYIVGGEAEQSGVFGAFTKKPDAEKFLKKIENDVGACIYEIELDKKWTASEIKNQEYLFEEDEQDEDDEPNSEENDMTGTYENHEDGHNKCWQLTKTKNGYEAHWGKCGGTMQGPKVYTFEEAEKVVREKLKKGYEKVA